VYHQFVFLTSNLNWKNSTPNSSQRSQISFFTCTCIENWSKWYGEMEILWDTNWLFK